MDECIEISGDAYIKHDMAKSTWRLGTNKIEKSVFLRDGIFKIESFRNKITDNTYINMNNSDEEFYLTVEGKKYSGLAGNWTYETHSTEKLRQGELLLKISFYNNLLRVTRIYIIYPFTGIIQEKTIFKNISGRSLKISNPQIINQTILNDKNNQTDFYYMTGGGNFTGSHMLKEVRLTEGFRKTFDSRGPKEVMTVEGKNDAKDEIIEGSGVWHEFYAIRNANENGGVFVTFDYAGTWFSSIAVNNSNASIDVFVHMKDFILNDGLSINMPLCIRGVFTGDLDDMGNTILDYVYRYKWDYTRDEYFAKTNAFMFYINEQHTSMPQAANAFQIANNARYIGAEIVHVDDFWYDKRGDWNNIEKDDFKELNYYVSKNGQKMSVWYAPWHADLSSKVLEEHPDWQVKLDSPQWYGPHLEQSNPETVNWEFGVFSKKQKEWGNHMVKYDGEPMWPSNEGDNLMLEGSNNWYDLLKSFKEENPKAGVFGCSSGGEIMTIESLRYSDLHCVTDGHVLHYNGYWSSLFTPLDKMMGGGGIVWGEQYSKITRSEWRTEVQINMNNAFAPMSIEDKEEIRKDVERYRFFKSRGVVGKWVKVYRPATNCGDPSYFMQKMSGDGLRGYITIMTQFLKNSEKLIIYPKGMSPDEMYTVSCLEGGMNTAERRGSEWMKDGITILPVNEGEMILINLEDRPGTGYDREAPTEPYNFTKTSAEYMGIKGVELNWKPATDNNWISYYEIFMNDQPIDKVSTGTFYFLPEGDINPKYKICTVDGDGNKSLQVEAHF